MQFGVYLVDDFAEVIVVVREVVMVCFDDQHPSEFIGLDQASYLSFSLLR